MPRQVSNASLKKPCLKVDLKKKEEKKKLWGLKVYWHYGQIESRSKDIL